MNMWHGGEDLNLLELRGISKSFGNNRVLTDVNFQLEKGQIHALLGENGAGKSTMLNIIYGILKADSGEIFVDDQKVEITDVHMAQRLGICFVHQEIELCKDATVAENIFMSEISQSNRLCVDFKSYVERAREILHSLMSDDIDPRKPVSSLPVSHQQVVEIAKALSNKCRILMLDEPTAALSENETESLFAIMKQLKEQGIGIIYISHRMSEIFDQCDKVTVLRDGKMISSYPVSEVNVDTLVRDMAGREVDAMYPPKAQDLDYSDDKVVLEVKDLTDAYGKFKNINFKLYQGEILGVAGLVGAGRSEIMQGLVGLRKMLSGEVCVEGKKINHKNTREAFDSGLVLLSEDRKKSGLFLEMGIDMNTVSAYLDMIAPGGVLNNKKEQSLTLKAIRDMNTRCTGPKQEVKRLSGGNQQKVMLGKLLMKQPKIAIMDEPTRGIDVGAKAEIHRLLRRLAQSGVGVIMVSSELNEVIGMSDRVLLLDIDGELVKDIHGSEIESDNIMYYITGAYKDVGGQNS